MCKYAFFIQCSAESLLIFFSLFGMHAFMWKNSQFDCGSGTDCYGERKTIKNCKKTSHRKGHYLLLLRFSCNKYKIVWVVCHSCVRRKTFTILAVCILYSFRMPPISVSVSGNNNMLTRRNTENRKV